MNKKPVNISISEKSIFKKYFIFSLSTEVNQNSDLP